jgi:aryl-alcohol dehydrogenase-like predicted oxidoreductase
MEFSNLGRTGVKVSQLCLGCMNFGGRTNEADAIEIIHSALAADINFIDTANVYGHDPMNFSYGRGRSEEIVGKALKQSAQRLRVVLATKAYFPMSDDPNAQGSSRRHLIEQCEASLKRLHTDYIDLYQLHHPSNDIPIDETLRALDDLIRAGKVRYIGTSSFAAWQIVESLWVSKEYHLNRFICEQPAYNLLDRRVERELIPMAQTYGMAIIPWSPTAGGFLTGKYQRDVPPPEGSRFADFWKGAEKRHYSEAAFAVLDVVETLSKEKGCTPYQLALAWCAQQPGVTSPIIGPRTKQHLADALQSLTIQLTAEDQKRIDAVAPPGRASVPYYGYDGMAWVTWGPHRFRW